MISKKILIFILFLILLNLSNLKGEEGVIFSEEFEDIESVNQRWKGGEIRLEQGPTGKCLFIEEPDTGAAKKIYLWPSLPIEEIRGGRLEVSGMIKAENVSKKPAPYNGIKIMLKIEFNNGMTSLSWVRDIETGTFDWKNFSLTPFISENVKSVILFLGLEKVSGRVWFDNIKVRKLISPSQETNIKSTSILFKGHSLPRLRGTMVNTKIDTESLKVLGEDWNANLVRWQLGGTGFKRGVHTKDYDKILDDELKKLDEALLSCKKYGLMVVIDLHSLAEGIFESKEAQEKFIEVWKKIVQKYKDNEIIWGYDLANEPLDSGCKGGALFWNDLAQKTSIEIRKIDPAKVIIVESDHSVEQPHTFENLHPVDAPNIVYSFHMYLPSRFTYQGVFSDTDNFKPIDYPGIIDGVQWNKEQIEKSFAPVINFAKKYNVHIYVGEFSAVRWAPNNSAYRYIKDVIEIFEKYDWDWTYHVFRGWQGWSVEHSEDHKDNAKTTVPNDREKLLKEWFAKNKKPSWYAETKFP